MQQSAWLPMRLFRTISDHEQIWMMSTCSIGWLQSTYTLRVSDSCIFPLLLNCVPSILPYFDPYIWVVIAFKHILVKINRCYLSVPGLILSGVKEDPACSLISCNLEWWNHVFCVLCVIFQFWPSFCTICYTECSEPTQFSHSSRSHDLTVVNHNICHNLFVVRTLYKFM